MIDNDTFILAVEEYGIASLHAEVLKANTELMVSYRDKVDKKCIKALNDVYLALSAFNDLVNSREVSRERLGGVLQKLILAHEAMDQYRLSGDLPDEVQQVFVGISMKLTRIYAFFEILMGDDE